MSRASNPEWLIKADKASPEERLGKVLGETVGHLASYLYGKYEYYLVSFCVKRRGRGDYIAVLTRDNDVEVCQEVAFGTGRTAVDAIVSVAKTIAKGAWKRQKPMPIR